MSRGRKPGKPTVKHIALEAGVSPTAVSLVLKDPESPRVGCETRKRILAIARRLNYRPNYIARSLVTKKTHTLGLVVTTLTNPFYAELARDIIECAQERNYSVLISSAQGRAEDQVVYGLVDRGVDGLIICSASRRDPVVDTLLRGDLPFSLVMRSVEQGIGDPPVDCVVIDNVRGAYMATEHLIGLGHVRIGHITGVEDISTAYERRAGFLACMAAHKLRVDPDMIVAGDFSRASGAQCAGELLRLEPRPTAISTVNDHMAVGVLDALREAGLTAPGDVAVVGFDDIEMAGLPGIDLTTISQTKAIMGRIVVDRLIEKIGGRGDRLAVKVILDPILVIRRTCGCGLHSVRPERKYP